MRQSSLLPERSQFAEMLDKMQKTKKHDSYARQRDLLLLLILYNVAKSLEDLESAFINLRNV